MPSYSPPTCRRHSYRRAARWLTACAGAVAVSGCGGVTADGPASQQSSVVTVTASAVAASPVTPAPTPTPSPTPAATPVSLGATVAGGASCAARVGINLSGAEFGNAGDKYGWGYIYPDSATLEYFKSRGVTLIRLPVKWERLQPAALGALDADEVGRLVETLDRAKALGLAVVVDLHNYGRYGQDALGSTALPESALADFWKKLAARLSAHPAFAGYGLMNEPHDMPNATAWPNAAQLAVNAIRTVDSTKRIYVAGDGWSSAQNWDALNPNLKINDPAGNFRYEAHQYFDRWSSGTYQSSYDADGAYPSLGADRLQPFVNFLKRTGAKGFIGEYGVPADDARWLTVMDNFLTAATAAGIDTTYWSAGQWLGSYALSVQPADGKDKPQLAVLQRYMEKAGGCAL